MKCPGCDVELMISDGQSTEIGFRSKCRGVWLDRGELDKLTERASRYRGDDDDRGLNRGTVAGVRLRRNESPLGSNGKELYYIAPDGYLMAAAITASGESFERGTPMALFQTRIVGGTDPNAGKQHDVSDDGRFLINTVLDSADVPITLLLNWTPEEQK